MYKEFVMINFTDKDIQRFWSKVDINLNNNSCWEWTACHNLKRYGLFYFSNKMYSAHRIAYMIERGNIPEEMFVCHRCDNPTCVNPNHLFIGTYLDNVRDRDIKNRNAKGSKQSKAKLTEEVIPVIRELLREGFSQQNIAYKYGVSQVQISLIKSGKIWKHVH